MIGGGARHRRSESRINRVQSGGCSGNPLSDHGNFTQGNRNEKVDWSIGPNFGNGGKENIELLLFIFKTDCLYYLCNICLAICCNDMKLYTSCRYPIQKLLEISHCCCSYCHPTGCPLSESWTTTTESTGVLATEAMENVFDVTPQTSHLAIKAMIQIKTSHHTDSVAWLVSSWKATGGKLVNWSTRVATNITKK